MFIALLVISVVGPPVIMITSGATTVVNSLMRLEHSTMIGNVEKNRIIRLKRLANYYRSRADNEELTKKQQTQAMANANAMSWAVQMAIVEVEHREKRRITHKTIDRIVKWLTTRKYWKLKHRYDAVEEAIRNLHMVDVMEHEKTYEGLQKLEEKKQAQRAAQPEA